MKTTLTKLVSGTFVMAICVAAGPAGADLLWDNRIDHVDDESSGRAVSPPSFPDIRVADDIVVPDGETWRIDTLIGGVLEDEGWQHGGVMTVLVYADRGGGDGPGAILDEISTTFDREFTGHNIRGRDYYLHTIDALDLSYGPGTYWIGIRHPNGDGAGTAYWVSDNGGNPPGGRDGQNTDTGWFSLDSGATWANEGPGWQHGFQLHGTVGPACPADLDGSGDVDFEDLLRVLAAWGNKGGPEDLDDSGDVGFGDLLILLAAWGACE